ncbi:MAG: GDSL-type esterase/lipase family protein [Armatimonadota bacterium]|nr:GDSL-type esterase/lipase family protein [Armatimonadota bacterium]
MRIPLFLILLVSLSLPACRAPAADRSFLQAGDEIVFVGDSITAQGAFENYLQQMTDTLYPGAGIHFVNRGVGGQSAPEGVDNLLDYLKDHKPTVIAVMYGVNDTGWSTGDVQDKEDIFVAALKQFAKIAQDNKLPLIFLRETPFSHAALSGEKEAKYNAVLDRMLEVEDRVAVNMALPEVDVHGAYLRALTAAWARDPRYQISPDIIHPTSPGHAAIAAEILRVMGAGLPLAAAGDRGPMHTGRSSPVSLEALDDLTNLSDRPGGWTNLTVRVRNLTDARLHGQVMVVVGKTQTLQVVDMPAWSDKLISVRVYDADLSGRWDLLPIYMAFIAPGQFSAAEAPFYYSGVVATEKEPLKIKSEDFTRLNGDTTSPCPVSDVSVSRSDTAVDVKFHWTDDKVVLAKGGFKDRMGRVVQTPLDPNARDGQAADAVEVLLDTRPDESTGRYTSNIDANPQGLMRVGIYKAEGDGKTVAKVQVWPEKANATDDDTKPDDRAVLTDDGAGGYTLHINVTSEGSTLGFTMRVTDVDEAGQQSIPVYYLTGKPHIAPEPLNFIRLGTSRGGMFHRVGY